MAVDYVCVVYNESSTNVDLDGKIRTYSDIAKAAAVDFLGSTLVDAGVSISALIFRGPIAATDGISPKTIEELSEMPVVSLGKRIDALASGGAWFLLTIKRAESAPGAYELVHSPSFV